MTDTYYTVDEVSKLFGVTRNAVIKWSNELRLPESQRANGRVRLYRIDYIKAVLDELVRYQGKWWSVNRDFYRKYNYDEGFYPWLKVENDIWDAKRQEKGLDLESESWNEIKEKLLEIAINQWKDGYKPKE